LLAHAIAATPHTEAICEICARVWRACVICVRLLENADDPEPRPTRPSVCRPKADADLADRADPAEWLRNHPDRTSQMFPLRLCVFAATVFGPW